MGMLEGKVALVTGGRGGIGRAICDRFLREGATVFAADLSAAGSLSSPDGESRFVQLDVTSEPSVQAAMAHVGEEADQLDILVNAAGIEIEKTIEETSLEEWNNSFAVNVTGTFLTSKHSLPLMRKAASAGASASIINFGSYDGFIADPGLAAYCATKGAVHALTRAMACDHGPEGIRVNAICPGYVLTPIVEKQIPDQMKAHNMDRETVLREVILVKHPSKQFATIEEMTSATLMLCGEHSAQITGTTISIDGGWTAG